MEEILKQVQAGNMSVAEAMAQLATYEELGFAKIDHHRKKRQGFPEVIFGEGKSADQIEQIIQSIQTEGSDILATRVARDKAAVIQGRFPELIYNETAELLYSRQKPRENENGSYIAIVSAGTSDMKVAEEAALTAEAFGSQVCRFYDVGVAGIHRLFNNIDGIRNASVSVVIAGMEGALASVVGGLVSHPVIAVPTSVGYGANFHGLSALLTMLNSCASGISVVNIDNGFGAAYNAVMIDRIARNANAPQ
ncbi:nickel pincer cofactor biosynthesis protein LarB [Virgibacillus halophilus]|uniref:Nickel pincer cofactor biosynthesis protein LarB n=1 Tax=Tigheibacillus halophilus TaxID=361280 RepID=A0ABU5C450_9BACI|nr:nickel pincer cofactor biosynthesis protein LarB [Virgibacillus halophilus]